jgi:hypothetical protein
LAENRPVADHHAPIGPATAPEKQDREPPLACASPSAARAQIRAVAARRRAGERAVARLPPWSARHVAGTATRSASAPSPDGRYATTTPTPIDLPARAATQIVTRAGDVGPASSPSPPTSTPAVSPRSPTIPLGTPAGRRGRPRPVPIDSSRRCDSRLTRLRVPRELLAGRLDQARLDHARPRPLGGRRTIRAAEPSPQRAPYGAALVRVLRPGLFLLVALLCLPCCFFPCLFFFLLLLTPSPSSLSSYLPNPLPHHHTPPTSLVLSFLCS